MAFDFPDTNGLADGFRITNPATGTEYAWRAASQKWVLINSAATGDYVKKAGDIMSGPLMMLNGDPINPEPIDIVNDEQAVHKFYVEERIEEFLPDLTDDSHQIDTIDERYVNKKGGDSMQGPLNVTGGRNANADGLYSIVKTLNVDSGQSSSLNLKWDGATKVYVGQYDLSLTTDLKFNSGTHAIYCTGPDKKGFEIDADGISYVGDYIDDSHVATKKDVEEAIFADPTDPDSNKFVKIDGDTMTGDLELPNITVQNDATVFNDIHLKAGAAVNVASKVLTFNDNGIFYEGQYIADKHIVTKKNLEEAIFNDTSDPDSNKFVKVDGDTMTGDLEMSGHRIVFNHIPDGGQVIRANRSQGESVDLLYLAHGGGSVLGYYDVKMTGNTSYNGIRFKGGSGGEEPIFEMRANGNYNVFHSDLRFDGNRIRELGDAVDDTDAVPYGQIKQELQDKFNEYVDTVSFGTYTYTVSNNPPQGYFAAYTTNGGQTEHTPSAIRQLWISKQNLAGDDIGLTSMAPGDIIRFADGANLFQFRVNGTPADQGTWLKIDVNKGTGPSDLIVSNDFDITLLKMTGGSVNLDDYLKLDASNSPLTGNLEINQGLDNTEAALTLTGTRSNTTNSAATVAFKNTNSTNIGYLTYRAYGSSQFFRFNQDVDLNNHGLHSVARIRMQAGGAICSDANERLKFKNASNANPGEGLLEVPRPVDNRRGFTIRGNDDGGAQTDLLYTYTNASGPDAINYLGKMDSDTNIVNLEKVKELIASGGGTSAEVLQSHGPYEYVLPGGTVSPGEFTTDTNTLKEVRLLTFNSKNQNGETDVWSDLAPGEVITIGQGSGDAYFIVNYMVTAIQNYSSATIVDVDAHQTFVTYSDGSVVYNPNDAFNFIVDTPTYVLESQPATLNNAVDLSNKASPGPAFNSYILDTGTGEPLLGIGKGKMISMGSSNIQTPTRFMFSSNDYYGNGHKMGANSFDCPGSMLELYRKNGDGTLCLCKVYEFSRVAGYGNNAKFEFRNLVEKHTATNNNSFFGSPGTLSPGAEYLVKYNINFTSTIYTIDEEGDPHYGDHRLEDIGHPEAATDAATKGYVDANDELLRQEINDLDIELRQEISDLDDGDSVKKIGDLMTGNLEMGRASSYPDDTNTNSPKIIFDAKKSNNTEYQTQLYGDTAGYLYSSSKFWANGTVSCNSASGFQFFGQTRIGFGAKTTDGSEGVKYGYLGIGTADNVRALEWSGSKGLQWLKANGTAGSQGQVLKKCRPASGSTSRPEWQGMVDIGTSTSNRSKGELWYNSNDQVLYLKVS